MIPLSLKKENLLPALMILAGTVIALIYRFDLSSLKLLAYSLFLIVCINGVFTPWLFLLATIPALFALDPAPASIGISEFMIITFLGLYTLCTYFQEWRYKTEAIMKSFLHYNLIFLLLLAFSFFVAMSKDILFADWVRAIIPFLILYLMIPLSFTFQNQFEHKAKWIFVAYVVFTFLIVVYTNIVFFKESYFRFFWLEQIGGMKIFDFTGDLDTSNLIGPYKDRITTKIQLATSELLPVCLTAFFAIAILAKSKKIRILATFLSLGPLFTILETYTRSMLMSSALVIFFLSILTFILFRPPVKYYVIYAVIIIFSTLIFTTQFNLSSTWFGRLNVFVNTLLGSKPIKVGHLMIERPQDENLLVRVEEYKKAWAIFSKNPILGGGLGVKHEMAFQTSAGNYLYQKVGYVHNWVMYWLMVGGILGLAIYTFLLFTPLYYLLKMNSKLNLISLICISVVLTMLLYACLFAVFRLISFNLILAMICGLGLCVWQSKKIPLTIGNKIYE